MFTLGSDLGITPWWCMVNHVEGKCSTCCTSPPMWLLGWLRSLNSVLILSPSPCPKTLGCLGRRLNGLSVCYVCSRSWFDPWYHMLSPLHPPPPKKKVSGSNP